MSGGYFDYRNYEINNWIHQIEHEIKNNDIPNEWNHCNNFSQKTLDKFTETVKLLKRAEFLLHQIDYLLSGDTSEETFWKQLKKNNEI